MNEDESHFREVALSLPDIIMRYRQYMSDVFDRSNQGAGNGMGFISNKDKACLGGAWEKVRLEGKDGGVLFMLLLGLFGGFTEEAGANAL